ncbi:Serine/threonine-protein phosphatase 7 long form-like [Vitis vinifera]|uniref:Serine/threonine-protein phosphatase 7 long form-like n=1 Tax=Vitis vinifera TaxID=29760 RepID=A0A438J1V4_VITVI|nr:Serine/threonine-protein phosphatase 7 long form-like [Vitis vinifera]
MLKLVNTFGMDEIELYIEQVTVQPRRDEDEEECESQEGDDHSGRAEDIQHDGDGVFEFIDEENNNVNVVSSFLALHEAMEGKQGRYVSVDGESCAMSNNPDPEDPIEFSLFSGEFMVGQVFNLKADLQHTAKLYSISAHQEYVVVESTTKLLVLRCKKAKQSQCPWKLRAMVVKGTTSFAINKYNGPHKCLNPCLNRDHQQLDSNLIVAHIQGMIKAQFTLSVAAIQASIVEKFGYQISYKKTSKAKLKALTNLFGDFYKLYAELPHFFIALEQANPGCVVISKTFPSIMENIEIFQRVFWTFHPSIEGFKHCRPILSIDGTYLYGKYKGTLMIAMGCDRNNQLFSLAFALIEDQHPGIMAAMSDVHLGCYVVVRMEQCANRLASNEEYTPYVDAKIKANVVKMGSHEIVLYDHIRGQFHVKTNKGIKSSSTRGQTYRINLQEYACTCDMEYRGHSSDRDPLDTFVLVLQDRHKSHLVDSGQLASVLTCRQHISRFMWEWEMDSRLQPYIILSGFYGEYLIGHITLDWGLITSLVERWRPETHTFHLPVGEMTITLQDVAVILGLRIHGLPITGTCDIDCAVLAHLYRELCRASLDGATDIAGCVTLLQRLHVGRPDFGRPPTFPTAQHLEHDAVDDLPAEQLDHGLQDKALLHEGLPADLLGCRWKVPLSWAQNPSRVLTFYRDQLDAQTHDQVLWEPYMGDLVAHLPGYL